MKSLSPMGDLGDLFEDSLFINKYRTGHRITTAHHPCTRPHSDTSAITRAYRPVVLPPVCATLHLISSHLILDHHAHQRRLLSLSANLESEICDGAGPIIATPFPEAPARQSGTASPPAVPRGTAPGLGGGEDPPARRCQIVSPPDSSTRRLLRSTSPNSATACRTHARGRRAR